MKIGELLVPSNKGAWEEVRGRLNHILRGWSAYFSYGALASAYEAVDQHVYDRARNFLRQRHKAQGVVWANSPVSTFTGPWPCDAFDASVGGRRRGP
jgi:Group II intron, maturase-specific domain